MEVAAGGASPPPPIPAGRPEKEVPPPAPPHPRPPPIPPPHLPEGRSEDDVLAAACTDPGRLVILLRVVLAGNVPRVALGTGRGVEKLHRLADHIDRLALLLVGGLPLVPFQAP